MVACAFMQQADTLAYQAVIRKMKEEVPGFTIPAYMGDFDGAMRIAMRIEFP